MNEAGTETKVLLISDCKLSSIQEILSKFHLELIIADCNQPIPGSYWGDSEAGLISNKVYVRKDTPIHSLLHETCHYICMDSERRRKLNTNAEGNYEEENGVCYLQILLANNIPEMGSQRMMQDMNTWGYTFREGSSENWFKGDAIDAFHWLMGHHLLLDNGTVSYQLRQ